MASKQGDKPVSEETYNMCSDLKEKHDVCFFQWYTEKFLKNQATSIECQTEYDAYQNCLQKKIDVFGIRDKIPQHMFSDPKFNSHMRASTPDSK